MDRGGEKSPNRSLRSKKILKSKTPKNNIAKIPDNIASDEVREKNSRNYIDTNKHSTTNRHKNTVFFASRASAPAPRPIPRPRPRPLLPMTTVFTTQ